MCVCWLLNGKVCFCVCVRVLVRWWEAGYGCVHTRVCVREKGRPNPTLHACNHGESEGVFCFVLIESPEAVSVSEWVRACGIAPLFKSTSAPKSWISVSGAAESFRPEISF